MNKSDILRLGGIVTVIAGLWTAVSAFIPFKGPQQWVFFVGTALTVFALFAVYAALAEASGILGLVAFALASAGNLGFFGQEIWGDTAFMVGGSVYALGLILLGIASLRSTVFSRWVGWLWIASVLVGIPGFAVPSLMTVFFAAGGLALGAAFALAGFELWTRRALPLLAREGEVS